MILIGFDGYSSAQALAGIAINRQIEISSAQGMELIVYTGGFRVDIIVHIGIPPINFQSDLIPYSDQYSSFTFFIRFTSPFFTMIPIGASGRG